MTPCPPRGASSPLLLCNYAPLRLCAPAPLLPQLPQLPQLSHPRLCTDVRTWFLVDLLTVLDFQVLARAFMAVKSGSSFSFYEASAETDVIDDGDQDLEMLRLVRTLRLFRLVKLLRILRASRIILRWQDFYGFSYATMTLVRLITTLAMLLHWYACLWAFVALQGLPGVDMNGLETWVQVTGMQECAGAGDVGQASLAMCADAGDIGPVYIVSLYVSVVALFGGIGSISPANLGEYSALTFILFTGCFFWAYVISSLCSMLATLNPHLTAFRHTMDELNHFMAENEFSQGHKVRIRRFFRATQDFVRRADNRRLLDKMSERLRGDTALLIGVGLLNKVWYFNLTVYDIEKGYLASVALELDKSIYEPKETFPIEDLTIVAVGSCCVGLQIMRKGRVVGLDSLIPEERSALRSENDLFAACLTFVETASISRATLMVTARPFPKAHAHLLRMGVKLTLRAAIRAVIRELRAEKLNIRNRTFDAKLWRSNTSSNMLASAKFAQALAGSRKIKVADLIVGSQPLRSVLRREKSCLKSVKNLCAASTAVKGTAAIALPAFTTGDRVMHEKRGPGTVAEITGDGMVKVSFDHGESHRYGAKSWSKLQPLSIAYAGSASVPKRRLSVSGVDTPFASLAVSTLEMESAMAAGFTSMRAQLEQWHVEQLGRMERIEEQLVRQEASSAHLEVQGTLVNPVATAASCTSGACSSDRWPLVTPEP